MVDSTDLVESPSGYGFPVQEQSDLSMDDGV
jgi:hypothetical protein